MAKKSTKTKSRPSPPKHIWKTIIITSLAVVLVPAILIGLIIIPELYESHVAREKYEKIPKAQPIDDFISYQIPSGWTKSENWIKQDPDENKRHQYINLLSPEYVSTNEGCSISLSARETRDSVFGGDDRKELLVDGHKAITYPYLTADYTQNAQIVQPLTNSKNRRIWDVVFLCETKETTQMNIKFFNEFLDSIKFK